MASKRSGIKANLGGGAKRGKSKGALKDPDVRNAKGVRGGDIVINKSRTASNIPDEYIKG
jgi:hypothetical protein